MLLGGMQAGKRSCRAGVCGVFGRAGWQGGALDGVCVLRVEVLGVAATDGGVRGEAQPLWWFRSLCLQRTRQIWNVRFQAMWLEE